MVADRFLNIRDFLNLVVEDNSQPVAYMLRRKVEKPLSTFIGQRKAHAGLATLVAAWYGVAQVFSTNRRNP